MNSWLGEWPDVYHKTCFWAGAELEEQARALRVRRDNGGVEEVVKLPK